MVVLHILRNFPGDDLFKLKLVGKRILHNSTTNILFVSKRNKLELHTKNNWSK